VWAGNDRIGTQRDDGGIQEVKQYFLHKDLQGSTNIVTDITGNTFQHHEYFATGEVWVDEKSTVFRTPYQYGGGYIDEQRKIINFGARWYDQRREMLYSPDPVLYDDPMAIVGAPTLRAAYAYANSNPLTYVDPGGREFSEAQREFNAKLAQNPELRKATLEQMETRIPKSFIRLGLDIEQAERRQELFEKIDGFAKSFVEINISTGEVLLSGGIFTAYKQWEVRKGTTNTGNQADATKKTVTFASGTKPAAPTGNGTVQSPNSGKSTAAPSRKVTKKPLSPLSPSTSGPKGST
jgi:RHS repeat-associated protein